jgi:hypothetical protein
VRGSLGQKASIDWWMSAEWAARDEQPILPTSTNPCIKRAAGTQGVNGKIPSDQTTNSLDTVELMGFIGLNYLLCQPLLFRAQN